MTVTSSHPTPDEIWALLAGGREKELVGLAESEQLDFKRSPHQLDTERGRWELAKDVAALANGHGGALVVGIATIIPNDRDEEIASEITPFPATMANEKRHHDSLDPRSGVYPTMRGVRIRRFDRANDKALLLIVVPPQDEDQKPFMTVRMIEGDEKRGVGVGVPLRSGPNTYWLSPGELHRDLSDGRRSRAAPPPLTLFTAVEGHAEAVDEMTARRLAGIEEYMGWDDTPTYLLGAVPRSSQPVPIPGMYDPNRIYGCVSRPPEIRAFGFSLGRADTPRNEDGSLVNLSADRSVLWLDPDGTCLAAAAGSPAFLTRGQSSAGPERRDINATVLVEWSYLFCLFVEQCLAGAIEGGWVFMARLRGAHSRPWSLSLQPGHSRNFWQDGRAPGLDEWHMEVAGTGDPGLDSFHLLVGLYGLFGLDERSIPFVSDDRVDPDLIRATSG